MRGWARRSTTGWRARRIGSGARLGAVHPPRTPRHPRLVAGCTGARGRGWRLWPSPSPQSGPRNKSGVTVWAGRAVRATRAERHDGRWKTVCVRQALRAAHAENPGGRWRPPGLWLARPWGTSSVRRRHPWGGRCPRRSTRLLKVVGCRYWSSFITPCWLWFAWASIAVEAWLRICALARLVVSDEKSASVIWLFAAVRLVELVVRLFTAD